MPFSKGKHGIEGSNQCTEGMGIWEENYTQRSEYYDHGIHISGVEKDRDGISREEKERIQKEEKVGVN